MQAFGAMDLCTRVPATAKLLLMAAPLWLGACSDGDALVGVGITLGYESEALTASPAVTTLRVRAVGQTPDEDIDTTVETAPGGNFDFGELPDNALVRFEVSGLDDDGTEVVAGRSLDIILGAAADTSIPVFVQRLDGWARPPGAMPFDLESAPGGILDERYVVASGGPSGGDSTTASVGFYDLLALEGATSAAEFPRAATTMIVRGRLALLIDDAGASSVDFDTGTVGDISPPSGLTSFAEVSGGATVEGESGETYVVGGTRTTGEPTTAILRVDALGVSSLVRTTTARRGAAATWVGGLGLVVVGGSTAGAGIELLPAASTTGQMVELAYPTDAVEGAGAISIGAPGEADDKSLLVAGGVDPAATDPAGPVPTRQIDLTCTQDCEPVELADLALPAGAMDMQMFRLPSGEFLAVSRATGTSFRLRMTPAELAEVPFREPRIGVTVVPTPLGTLLATGGRSPAGAPVRTAESFFPR